MILNESIYQFCRTYEFPENIQVAIAKCSILEIKISLTRSLTISEKAQMILARDSSLIIRNALAWNNTISYETQLALFEKGNPYDLFQM